MIKVGDLYEITTDKYQYILTTKYTGKDKDGNEKQQTSSTYHGTIKQVVASIADSELKKAFTAGVIDEFTMAIDRLTLAISSEIETAGGK